MHPKDIYKLLKSITDYIMAAPKDEPPALYAFQPFRYEEIKPNAKSRVPYPRSGHRIAANSANLYSFGGYNPVSIQSLTGNMNFDDVEEYQIWNSSIPLFRQMWRFNFATKQWVLFRNGRSLPRELASNAVLLHKNLLLVYGGTGAPFGLSCSNQLHVCRINSDNNQMEEVPSTGQKPLKAYGQALVHHNDFLYTIGGTTGSNYSCDVHRLNLKSLKWEAVYICRGGTDFEPAARYRHEVASDSENIYLLGGGTAHSSFDFFTIPAFSIKARNWFQINAGRDPKHGIPGPRRCHGAVQIQSEHGIDVFIAGGHSEERNYNDLWRLDLVKFQWHCFDLCRLPNPTYFHATTATPEGRLYIFGGICSSVSDADVMERSNCIYSTWLCIPKLSEMCWEAVLHYSPNIAECGGQRLLDLGLPRHFVQRIDANSMVIPT